MHAKKIVLYEVVNDNQPNSKDLLPIPMSKALKNEDMAYSWSCSSTKLIHHVWIAGKIEPKPNP